MGTSSSYGGPTGSNPLLPPWADPLPPEYPLPDLPTNDPLLPPEVPPANDGNPSDGDSGDNGDNVACPAPNQPIKPPTPPPSWRGTKVSLTNYAKNPGGSGSPRKILGKYVRSRGGARMAAHTARAGRSVTAGVGGFLSDVRANGFREAVRSLVGQDLVGRDPMGALATIIDAIAPDGALREESAARLAAIETFNALAERYDVQNQGIEAIGEVTEVDAREMIALSIATFVNAQFQEELILRVESGDYSEAQANRMATEIRGFIVEETQHKLDTQNALALDLRSEQGRELTRQLYQDAFSFLEMPQ